MGNASSMSASCFHFSSHQRKPGGERPRVPVRTHWFLRVLVFLVLPLTPSRGVSLDPQNERTESASHAKPSQLSEREQAGLRGPVKAYVEETPYPPQPLSNGKETPEMKRWEKTEYDVDGHVIAKRFRNPDGSEWVTRFIYSPAGMLLKVTSGKDPEPGTETNYRYDKEGRLESITYGKRPDNPVTFRYDENGRKTKVQISRPDDYQPNVSSAGVGFEGADRAPNRPGGGSATTIYDADDRPVEVAVRDLQGELLSRTVRIYDNRGNIVEEKQTMDDVTKMIPAETQNKMLAGSGVSLNDLRNQLAKFLGGQGELWSVAYTYDAQGRVAQTTRRILNHSEDKIESTYNDHGDVALEITHSTFTVGEEGKAPETRDSEAHYSYQYDDHGNWTEKNVSHRSSPDGALTSSNETTRMLDYF